MALTGLGVVVLAGCGGAPHHSQLAPKSNAIASAKPSTATPPRRYFLGAQAYQGSKNLQHLLALAQKQPTVAQAQYHAAVSEYVNGHNQQALTYYRKAIRLNPKDGRYDNAVGNIYNYTLHQPKTALPYYEKAIQLTPSYDYGWYNLVNAEMALKNFSQAKSIAQKALKVLPKTDKLYPLLQKDAAAKG